MRVYQRDRGGSPIGGPMGGPMGGPIGGPMGWPMLWFGPVQNARKKFSSLFITRGKTDT